MSKYVYPAVLTPEKGGYFVNFPDIESCYTQGDDLADALEMAKDVLALRLRGYENEKKAIPRASKEEDFALKAGQLVSWVASDTLEYRKLMELQLAE